MIRVRSGRIELALHPLHEGNGASDAAPLLCLHALGGSSDDFRTPDSDLGRAVAAWPGRAFALDLAGHGASDVPHGRAYSTELWVQNADAALDELERCAVVGVGTGAFAALLFGAARAERVPGVLLVPGAGFDGCGEAPDADRVASDREDLLANLVRTAAPGEMPDPLVLETEAHHRPGAYARAFAEGARKVVLVDDGAPKPPWWEAIAPGSERVDGVFAGVSVLADAAR